MWTQFTERARRVVFFAQEEARVREQWNVSALHMMLGILREDGSPSVAQRVLMLLGGDRAELYRRVADLVPAVREVPGGEAQLTPDARRAIDWAYEEARRLKNHYLGTEHLLLGVLAVQEQVTALLPPDGLARARDLVRQLQEPGGGSEATNRQPPIADQLASLSPADWTRLSGGGLPLKDLPEAIQQSILAYFGCARMDARSNVNLEDCILRLTEETDASGKRYHLSLRLTAHAVIPVRGSGRGR